jgi:hypothetical protein
MDTFIQGTLRGGKENVGASEHTFGLLPLAGTIQLRRTLALTPTLSPKERETLSSTAGASSISDSFQRGQ